MRLGVAWALLVVGALFARPMLGGMHAEQHAEQHAGHAAHASTPCPSGTHCHHGTAGHAGHAPNDAPGAGAPASPDEDDRSTCGVCRELFLTKATATTFRVTVPRAGFCRLASIPWTSAGVPRTPDLTDAPPRGPPALG